MNKENLYTNEPELYAVYGTLMSGFGNHRLLSNSSKEGHYNNLKEGVEFVGVTKTKPIFKMYDLGFPGIVAGNKSIHIEVYRVSNPFIKVNLDRLEGHDRVTNSGMYRCEQIDTEFGKAWIYIWNSGTSRLKEIESGNYRDKYKNLV